MRPSSILVLRTLPGHDRPTAGNPEGVGVFRMAELGEAWLLQSSCFDIRYSSLDRALGGLASIVEWSRWTPEAQATIRRLSDRVSRQREQREQRRLREQDWSFS